MYKFAFVGNPNAGKSTWINYLSGAHFKVANYLGVSVQEQTTSITYKGEKIAFIDLPGIYDLFVQSGEETYTKDYLDHHQVDLLVNVIDIRDLQRGLHLTSQLKTLQIPMLVLLNYVEEDMEEEKMKELSKIIKLPILFSSMQQKETILDTLLSLKGKPNAEKIAMYEVEKLQLQDLHKHYELDRYFLHPIWGIPILILILVSAIFGIYMLSTPLADFITSTCEWASAFLLHQIPNEGFWYSIVQAMLFTFTSILSFIPFLFGVFILLSFLEESGYIARIAYLLDGGMRIFHLSGRSVIPMLIGFGCNVPAIMATRTISSKKERVACALMIPFVSCSAKLPIFLLFTSVFFKDQQIGVILFLYALSLFVSLFIGAFLSMKQGKEDLFMIELPSYALPRWKTIWNKSKLEIQYFLKKVGKVMIVSMLLLTFLFPFFTSSAYQKVYTPLGFSESKEAVESIPFGLISKENLVVYYAQKKGVQKMEAYVDNLWSDPNKKLKALCYLLFLAMSIPCIMTLASIKSEFGYPVLGLSILIMLVVPYLVSYVAYTGILFFRSFL